MSFVKINAITVPADSGDMLAQRFAKRQGAVDGQDGFEGFELLKPLDADRPVWLVVTRWRDEASYEAWVAGDAFGKAHGGQKQPGEVREQVEGEKPQEQPQRPVGMSAEQWSYEVVDFEQYQG